MQCGPCDYMKVRYTPQKGLVPRSRYPASGTALKLLLVSAAGKKEPTLSGPAFGLAFALGGLPALGACGSITPSPLYTLCIALARRHDAIPAAAA